MNKVWYLQRINIFSEMKPAQMEDVAQVSAERDYVRHELVFMPEDRGDSIYLIKTGRVKISKFSEEGKEITLAVLGPGEIFGEEALRRGASRSTFAEIVENAHLCVIHRDHFERLMRDMPELSLRMTTMMSDRLRGAQKQVEELVFKDLPSRLAGALVELAQKYGAETSQGTRIDIKITHQEIANLVGSTRETVTTTLNQFKRDGLLCFEGRKIVIRDANELKRIHGA